MESNPKMAGARTEAPVSHEARDEKPRFALTSNVSTASLSEFYRAHFARNNGRGMWIVRICGLVLIALGAADYFLWGGGSAVFEVGSGAGFFVLSFLLGNVTARSVARKWNGPTEARYRFYEDGLEVFFDRGVERRPYSDITEIVASRGMMFLYLGKMRAYVFTREALGNRGDELIDFLERKTGKRAVRTGRDRAA